MGLAFSRIWERMFGKKEMVTFCVQINQCVATPSSRRSVDGVEILIQRYVRSVANFQIYTGLWPGGARRRDARRAPGRASPPERRLGPGDGRHLRRRLGPRALRCKCHLHN